WKYIGCSHQSVPSLSNVAIRSGGGTKSGEPSFVTFSTKETMACLAGPSFHEGSGSWAYVVVTLERAIASRTKVMRVVFMCLISEFEQPPSRVDFVGPREVTPETEIFHGWLRCKDCLRSSNGCW